MLKKSMNNIVVRMLMRERSRTLITIAGTGTLLLLMLFLAGIYEGVKNGSTGFIRHSSAQIWACQKNSNNLLRSSSFLSNSTAEELAAVSGVKKVEAILRLLATAEIHNKNITAFIFGIPLESELSSPPIVRGRPVPNLGEIILDQSIVKKYNLDLGDTIRLNGDPFILAGISRETNATVAQFSFITLTNAEQILGFESISSFFLISVDTTIHEKKVLDDLKQNYPELSFYSKEEFIANNLDEMKTGVLPILWTIALLGFITGSAIISLLLYASAQEHREDYALFKALGMSQSRIAFIVLRQALLISFGGYVVALCGYVVCSPILLAFAPEISVDINREMCMVLLGISFLLGCIGSFLSVNKLSNVYPTEVFRA